jgi:hypothetical protein
MPASRRHSGRDGLGVVGGAPRRGQDGAGAVGEHRDRRHLREGLVVVRRRGRRHGERQQRVLGLAPHAQRRAAGDQDDQAGAGGDEVGDRLGGAEQVLEVVEHQQQPQRGEVLGEQALGVGALDGRAADRARDGGDHLGRVGQRCQRHDRRAVGERRVELGGHGRRQPRLADPARAGQGDQAPVGGGEQAVSAAQLLVAAEQPGRRVGTASRAGARGGRARVRGRARRGARWGRDAPAGGAARAAPLRLGTARISAARSSSLAPRASASDRTVCG